MSSSGEDWANKVGWAESQGGSQWKRGRSHSTCLAAFCWCSTSSAVAIGCAWANPSELRRAIFALAPRGGMARCLPFSRCSRRHSTRHRHFATCADGCGGCEDSRARGTGAAGPRRRIAWKRGESDCTCSAAFCSCSTSSAGAIGFARATRTRAVLLSASGAAGRDACGHRSAVRMRGEGADR